MAHEGESDSTKRADFQPERFRCYLSILARTGLDPRLQPRVGVSDIVQETIIEAQRDKASFRGTTEEAQAAWMRQILAKNLLNAHRDHHREMRDVDRDRSLEGMLENSSCQLGLWAASIQSSPSARLQQEERTLKVAEALSSLPDGEIEAVVLRFIHGWGLAQIGERLQLSRFQVMRRLREALARLQIRLEGLQ